MAERLEPWHEQEIRQWLEVPMSGRLSLGTDDIRTMLAEIDALRAQVDAARSILWMAQAYAEGGGSNGPEMRELLAAVSIIGED